MMMKLLILFIATLMISSCIKEFETTTEFSISNETNDEIEIKISNFETGDSYPKDTMFTLDQNKMFSYSYYRDGKDAPLLHPFGLQVDTVTISFNNETYLYTRNDTVLNNPIFIENYSGGKIDDGFYKYNFSVIEQNH